MVATDDKLLLDFANAAEWEAWLEANFDTSPGVRLRIAKKGQEGLQVVDALDVALCFGWIDGVRRGNDEVSFIQTYGPRRPRGLWSQVNRDKVNRLIAEGRMRPSGQLEIDRAKADGRWDAAYRVKDTPVPDDLQAALDANPAAASAFTGLSGQNRWAILFRVMQAKKPETRERRITSFVADLAAGTTIYPQNAKAATPESDGSA